MPQVESSIVIQAPRQAVMAVARDNEKFPEFMSDLQSLTVLEKNEDGSRIVSEWVAVVPKFGNKLRWVEEDVWDEAAGTCTFRQLRGDYKRLEGVWRFTPEGENATRFSSLVDYEIEIPLVGPLIKAIIRKAVQDNVDATLRAIGDRCEGASAR
jgi:uncharacterized membrane protein